MKNPLTSKERRGLVAVAAAALLCIASGFIFRNCSSRNDSEMQSIVVIDKDSGSAADASSDSVSVKRRKGKTKSEPSNGKRSRREKRKKAEKTYPTRSPLDEPCD